jgi:hypothetical protein
MALMPSHSFRLFVGLVRRRDQGEAASDEVPVPEKLLEKAGREHRHRPRQRRRAGDPGTSA